MPTFLTKAFIVKFIKFCAVGFSGLALDFGITFLLKEKLRIHKYVSNTIGFSIAASSNYFLNRVWTFHSHNPAVGLEYSRFILIAMVGLGINTFILWFLVSKYKMNFYLAKLFAVIVVTLWNFIASIIYTFV